MIEILAEDRRTRALWDAVMDLSDSQPEGWTLIGAQMVALHGFERGQTHSRVSLDADLLADVRVLDRAPQRLAEALQRNGFQLIDARRTA
jgi:hypothetical protein